MENSITWFLIADASKARIFALHKLLAFKEPDNIKNLQLVAEYHHAESRKKNADLVSDKMGEFGTGTFVESQSPKAHEAEQFALQLIHYLKAGRNSNSFRDLALVAPPNFMGVLNKHMPHELKKAISNEIEKDYTQLNGRELLKNLLNHL